MQYKEHYKFKTPEKKMWRNCFLFHTPYLSVLYPNIKKRFKTKMSLKAHNRPVLKGVTPQDVNIECFHLLTTSRDIGNGDEWKHKAY